MHPFLRVKKVHIFSTFSSYKSTPNFFNIDDKLSNVIKLDPPKSCFFISAYIYINNDMSFLRNLNIINYNNF